MGQRAASFLLLSVFVCLQCRLCPHALEAAFQPDCHASDCFAAFCHRIVDYLVVRQQGLISYTLLGLQDVNIYGFRGLLFAQTLSYFPIAYLLLNGVLGSIDPSIEEAARNMGASRGKTFLHVTLPLCLPGIANAFLLVFIKSVADFGNPITIGGNYQTLATQIYYQAIGNYDMQGGAAVAILLLLISIGLLRLVSSG